MPFAANVIKVIIASPGDVSNERQVIRDMIADWNYIHAEDRSLILMPVGWETHSTPAMGARPQAIINKQVLVNCDLLVAVFWTHLGSPTGQAASGTVEEIEEHLRASKPAMHYFSIAPVRLDSVDDEQYKALKAFKEECYKKGLVESFNGIDQFREKFFGNSLKPSSAILPTLLTVWIIPPRSIPRHSHHRFAIYCRKTQKSCLLPPPQPTVALCISGIRVERNSRLGGVV